jgi:CRISPR-associated protein Cmr3
MSLYTLEPRDPLVVRDGRPNHGRSESATLRFPYPGTIAGMVRTRIGSDERGFFDPAQDLEALRSVAVRGPLLARPDVGVLYVPAPRDAVVTGGVLARLRPIDRPPGALFDGGLAGTPVGLDPAHAGSTRKAAPIPAWWPWDLFARWLVDPGAIEDADADKVLAGCLGDLTTEGRWHVKLGETWTADEGMLFQARGLRFVTEKWEPLAIAVDVDATTTGGRTLRDGIAPAGGERRLARWEPAPRLSLPSLPDGVRAALREQGPRVRVRVVLLTPAIFAAGSTPGAGPGQLLGPRCGVTPKLAAACVPRPETISGWDLAAQRPKRTRRLARAGSVYWIDLEGEPDARVRWAEEVTMSNVSDDPQDRRDGFGLAAVGVA